MFSGQKCIKNNLKQKSKTSFSFQLHIISYKSTSFPFIFQPLLLQCHVQFWTGFRFSSTGGFLEEGKERHTVVDWWQAEQWKSAVRNLSSEEMGGRHRPAAMFLTWLSLINVWQSRTPPLKGLMSHSRDSPHPPPFVWVFTARVGSPRCHVCTNYPDSSQHAPQISSWPQPPLKFALYKLLSRDPLTLKIIYIKLNSPNESSLIKRNLTLKIAEDYVLRGPPPPELMLSSQPPSPSD